ncbi:MAG: four helix bundle protein [Bacteroidales bacterium]|nr:four helix bundle protein [Bacteroidales bacterium]
MEHKFSFEKLNVWETARQLTKTIYIITKEQYPDTEKFGLVSQMRRAAVSVCSNIAEGTSRTSTKDQAHFYQISYSSLMELLNQCIISNDLNYISEETLVAIRAKVEKTGNMLNSLRKSCLNKQHPNK